MLKYGKANKRSNQRAYTTEIDTTPKIKKPQIRHSNCDLRFY